MHPGAEDGAGMDSQLRGCLASVLSHAWQDGSEEIRKGGLCAREDRKVCYRGELLTAGRWVLLAFGIQMKMSSQEPFS